MKSLNVNLYGCSFLRGNKLCRLRSEMQRLSLQRVYNKAASVCEYCTIANSRSSPNLLIKASPSLAVPVPSILKSKLDTFFFPQSFLFKGTGLSAEHSSACEWKQFQAAFAQRGKRRSPTRSGRGSPQS